MSPTRVTTDFAGAWRRAGAALAWVGGVAWQLQQPALWDAAAWPLLAGAALATWLVARVARRRGRPGLACVLSGLALAIAGFGYAGWRAELRLADALAPAWEGCDIELVGTVDDMPQLAPEGERFSFAVESARPLAMTPRELRRVRSLADAAGQPWPAAVAAAETAGAQAPVPGDDDDDEAIVPAPPPGAGRPAVPSRVWLMWGRNQRDDRSVAEAPPPLRAGQRWRLPVRLRRPHGAMNPDGFDAELWLFDQGLRATGTVRGNGRLLSTSWSPIANARQWVRDRLLLAAGTGPDAADAAAHGALAALAVGDQAAIDGAGWEVFRNTGVAHLMSISGLHITMLGWLGGAAVGALWRRSERAALLVPAPAAARWGGLGVAWLYALLAGWGVPAQRTVVMLAATAALRGAGLDWPAALVALAAMLPVTLLDPWALLQPGFWLSFAAVGLLMVSTPARPVVRGTAVGAPAGAGARLAGDEAVMPAGPRLVTPLGAKAALPAVAGAWARDVRRERERERSHAVAEASTGLEAGGGRGSTSLASLARQGLGAEGPAPAAHRRRAARAALARLAGVVRAGGALAGRIGTELRGGVRAQLVATVGLAPLTLVAFQQVSPAGLLANLVAEPWVTLVVTPLTLLGILLPPLWALAALALKPLLWWLAWLARWPLASVHVATGPAWSLAAGLAGGAVLMLPLPWRVRGLGLLMLPPLLWPFVQRPPEGRFELVAADVGQGTAVLVRTHGHLLLFDTGPRFGDDDAGRRLLLPLLQARGEPRVDTLLLSHADTDHVGGAQSLVDRLPVLALRSSLPPANPLRANPIPHTPCLAGQAWDWDGVRFSVLHPFAGDYRPGAKTNALSCVLRVVGADGRSALLTGDVEAAGEARLVAQARAAPDDPAVRLRSDVLVVPHHGSRTSSTEAFLDAVRPGVAVIQVGYRSRYGHPAPDVVARYRAHGIPVVRSDHCGAWTWSDGRARCTRAVRRRYWHWQDTDGPLTPAWIGRPPPPGEP